MSMSVSRPHPHLLTYLYRCTLGPFRFFASFHGPCADRPPKPARPLSRRNRCVCTHHADLTRQPEVCTEPTGRCTNHRVTRRAKRDGPGGMIPHGHDVGAQAWQPGVEHLRALASTRGVCSLRRVGGGHSVREISRRSSFQAGAGTIIARKDTGIVSTLVSVSAEVGT